MKTTLILIVSWLWMLSGHAEDDRIIVEGAKVNGTPGRLFFDTGADRLVLFSAAVERLGLKVSPVRNLWRQTLYTATEKCTVEFWGFSRRERVAVVSLPAYVHETGDGVVGWSAVADKVVVFDPLKNTVQFVSEVPKETAQWTKLKLRIWDDILALKVSDAGRAGIIVLDTGSPSGVGLSARRWREWRESHKSQPVTLDAFYTPGAGLVVREQAWASDFTLGPLALTDLVLEEADPVSVRQVSKRHVATLGLAALKRLDLIVDGRNAVAYLRPKTTSSPEYKHNRSGAVFVPSDEKSDTLIARVVDGGPAYEAGIRNGDILLRIGEKDVTHWRTSSNSLSVFWQKPAGTELALTLRRSNETFKTTVTLRDILAPKTNWPSSQ